MKGLLLSYLCLLALQALVRAEFVLLVNLVDYTNPTGLCAECQTTLDQVNSTDELVPVCCDQLPFTSENCDNTGDSRCDTRFRWRIRPHGSSLESRPASIPNAVAPPYNFTNCNLSHMCPSSEMTITFSQNLTGLLGVTPNPLVLSSALRNLNIWTGRIQFLIEAVDSYLPNIIDSILVNLDLQLGADFTEERTYSGYHNISHMTMSFRVECASGYCGNDCTRTPQNTQNVQMCRTNGIIVCNIGRDPQSNCTTCLQGWDNATNCTTCLPGVDCMGVESPIGVAVAGAVVALVVVAVIVGVVIVGVVLWARRSCSRKQTPAVTAMNSSYEHALPAVDLDNDTADKTNTAASHEEHDFDNPLYDSNTAPAKNDYSSPWDTQARDPAKPLVVSSVTSTHAVVMRVNSNDSRTASGKKGSLRERAELQENSLKKRQSYENTKLASTGATNDYAEPENLNISSPPASSVVPQPQPVYDSADGPMYDSADVGLTDMSPSKVKAYEYNTLPGFSEGQRTFDNTGEHGVYYSSNTHPTGAEP